MSVCVIGDIMLDKTYIGNSSRIAQEACIPIINTKEDDAKYNLGGAGNVYKNLISMNIKTDIMTTVGKDKNGDKIIELLRENEDNVIIIDEDRTTTTKNRFYVCNKLVFRYDSEDTYDINKEIEKQILYNITRRITKYDLLILSDYDKGVITDELSKEIIELCLRNNKKIYVDPKKRNVLKYKNCTMVKPNQNECEYITGKRLTKNNMRELSREVCEKIQSKACLLTMGGDGMIYYDKERDAYINMETDSKNVIDITGAGDVVMSAFVYGVCNNMTIRDTIRFANYCGELKVSHLGTYNVSPIDILGFNGTKIIKKTEDTIKILKRENKKIVFTNGCFDIIHYGHLKLLQDAKRMGDILIVGLNSDDSIKVNKGDSRPINNIEMRVNQLSALNYVDYIIIFNDPTPYNVIEKIRPNILVKGGDYKMENIIGREFCDEIKIIPYEEGYSTTNMVKKMKNEK